MGNTLLMHMGANPQMWGTFAIIALAIYLYATETFSLIMTSLLVLMSFLLLFHFMPITDATGTALLNTDSLLLGFSNPALVAVLALLVLGQGVVRTGALNPITHLLVNLSSRRPFLAVVLTLVIVALISALVNNTPTVVIFIPILLAVAANLGKSASQVMIPLSYASILGGTTVLIGSSTNLLVSAVVQTLGLPPLSFFEFTLPGLVIAGVGMVYLIFVLPKMLKDRAPLSDDVTGKGKQFVAQLQIAAGSEVVGHSVSNQELFGAEEVTIKILQRHEHAYLPPFKDDIRLEAGDVLVITASRESIKTILTEKQDIFQTRTTFAYRSEDDPESDREESALTEILISPASKLVGQTVEQIGFFHQYHAIVLGMQRKSRAITSKMTKTRLQAGDVLLIMAQREHIRSLRESKDLVVMDWSTEDLPSKKYARRVSLIFGAAVILAITGILPIHISALLGSILIIAANCINLRQAMRAIDAQIIFLVAAGLAMSTSLQATGGAALLADTLINATNGWSAVFVMSALFLLMALLTNVLSNNANALLFTPIAVNTANQLGVPPEMFIYAVIFASNCCSLASPIGYQTNLLVMGPGHYRFSDYMKAGIPLVFIVWITYTTYSYFVYS